MSISISTFLPFQTTSKLPDSLSAPLPPALTPHTQVNDIVQTSDGLRHTRASTTYIKGDEPPTASLGTYLRRQGRRIEPSKGDGNCLFRTFSYQLTGTQDEHLALRTIAVRVVSEFFSQISPRPHSFVMRLCKPCKAGITRDSAYLKYHYSAQVSFLHLYP